MKYIKYLTLIILGIAPSITFGAPSKTYLTNSVFVATTTAGCLEFSALGEIFSKGTACGAGGGGSAGGTWSTTTSSVLGQLINYSNNTTDIVTVGGTATTTGKFFFDPNTNRFIVVDGVVGIGTTTPSTKFQVYSSANRYVHFFDTQSTLSNIFRIDDNSATNLLTLENRDTTATTDHGVDIDYRFADNTSTSPIFAGSTRLAKEQQWTGTASTRDSYYSISNATDGTVSEKLRITSAGNVGIGTTSPQTQLELSGTSGATITEALRLTTLSNSSDAGRFFSFYGNTGQGVEQARLTFGRPGASATGYIGFSTYDTSTLNQRMRLDYQGLRIGSTYATGANFAPVNGLVVEGNVGIGTTTVSARLHTTGTDGGTYPFAVSGNSKGLRIITSSTGISIQGVDSTLVNSYQPISLDGSVVTIKSGGTTEAIKADTNQNIGLGSTTPGTRLSIGNTGNDTINISPTATSTFGSGINLRTGCFAVGGVCITGGGGGGVSGPVTTTIEPTCEPQTDSMDFAPGGAYWQPIYGWTFTNATSSRIICSVAIPKNLATTPNILILPLLSATGTPSTGIAVVDVSATTTNSGQNWYTTNYTDIHAASTTASKRWRLTTGTSLPLTGTTTIALAGFVTPVGGDILKFELTRYGADANDTVDNDVFIPKVLVQLDTN